MWLREGVAGAADGSPYLSYFDFEQTYWEARKQSNLLMVHYRDLKSNLDDEMRRIAGFLNIPIDETIWPSLVKAATFEEMRRHGEKLAPRVMKMFSGGPADFFQKGENDRWRGVLDDRDLSEYETKLAESVSVDCAKWLRHGRFATEDSRRSFD